MKPKTQLDTLAEQFAHWRATRGTNRQTPSHLAKAALELTDAYSKSEIIQALGINNHALKRWERLFNPPPVDQAFVELTDPNSAHSKPVPLRLQLQQADLTLTVLGDCHELANFVMRLTQGK